MHGAQLHGNQIGSLGPLESDREIRLHFEGVGGFYRALELDRDTPMAFLQPAELWCQPIGGQSIGDGDPDHALHALVGAMDVALDIEHRALDMAGGVEDALAFGGEGDPIGQAVE